MRGILFQLSTCSSGKRIPFPGERNLVVSIVATNHNHAILKALEHACKQGAITRVRQVDDHDLLNNRKPIMARV